MSSNNTRVVAPTPRAEASGRRARISRPRKGHQRQAATTSPKTDTASPVLRTTSESPAVSVSRIPKHNLRSTASSLATHLERFGNMSVSTLTECVLRDAPNAINTIVNPIHASADRDTQSSPEVTADLAQAAAAAERNSCRRVYDAIKVMCAVGVATRTSDKQLVWKGRSHILPQTYCSPKPSHNINSSGIDSTPPSNHCDVQGANNLGSANAHAGDGLPFAALSPSTSNEYSPAPGMHCEEPGLSRDLSLYTSLDPSSPMSTVTAGATPNEKTSKYSPGRIRALVRTLRASVNAKRIRNESISARIAAFSSLLNRNGRGGVDERCISVPFVLVRGEPTSMKRSSGHQSLEMSFVGKPPELYSETDILVMLHKRTTKKRKVAKQKL